MHPRLIRCLVPLAGALMLVASTAGAQERPNEFESYDIPGWSFTPSFTFGTLFDSNVALTGRTGQPEGTLGDTLFTMVPGGRIAMLSNRTQFSAGYRGYLRRYVDVDELNGFDQRAYAALRHAVTPRLTIFGNNDFSESPTTDTLDLNGLPFLRLGSLSNRLNGGIEARLTKYTTLRARYENTWTRFENLENLVNNGTIHGFVTDVRRRLSERLTVGAEGRIRRSDLTSQESRVIWFQDAGGVVDYRVGSHTMLSASAGFSRVQDSRFPEARQNPYLRADLTQELPLATIGIRYERAYTPSFGFGGSTDNREIRGYVSMPFGRNRFYVQADAGWRRSDPSFGDIDLQLDTFLTDATFGYSATRWFRVEAYHAWSLQDSIVTGGEVSRHRVGAQFVVSQPMRIH
jgi:hypothetical protein